MGIQLPQRFFVVTDVNVIDVTGFRADQKAERVEMIPKNAFNFAFHFPSLAAFRAAIVDAGDSITAARKKCLDLKRMELDALHFIPMTQRCSHYLCVHVPQQDSLVRRATGQQIPTVK